MRKALESSDDSDDEEPVVVNATKNGYTKRYKLNVKPGTKARLQDDDFPELK